MQPDISYREVCLGTTASAYFHPQQQHPEEDVGFIGQARLCNEDSVHKMHRVFVLLPIGVLAAPAAAVVHRRQRSV